MATNLLDLAKDYFSDEIVKQIGNRLGEDQQSTQKALGGVLPTILNGLVQKSTEPGGVSSIVDMINGLLGGNQSASETITTGSILGNLGGLLTDNSQYNSLLSIGSNIIKNLFGDKSEPIANAIARYGSIKQSSASSLLSIAGPVLLSLLGKEGTSVSQLSGLLSSQSSSISGSTSSELSTLLGAIPGLSFLTGSGQAMTERVAQPVVPPPVYETNDRSSDNGNRWLPWLLLLLGAAALFFIIRSCSSSKKSESATTEAATDSIAAAINTSADSVAAELDSAAQAFKNATAKLGTFFKRKLPSGLELNIPELGIENKLIQFIEDKDRPVDKTTWFNFDRLLFDTGKSTLRPESQEQLNNIAAILKEYPTVHIKLGGYTDNTGSAAVNKKLSQERADSVMGQLVKLGVDQSRMEAEGYGPEHPVASNDTEAGRAENRRIAIRVTQK